LCAFAAQIGDSTRISVPDREGSDAQPAPAAKKAAAPVAAPAAAAAAAAASAAAAAAAEQKRKAAVEEAKKALQQEKVRPMFKLQVNITYFFKMHSKDGTQWVGGGGKSRSKSVAQHCLVAGERLLGRLAVFSAAFAVTAGCIQDVAMGLTRSRGV
jgi:hypothetical protein